MAMMRRQHRADGAEGPFDTTEPPRRGRLLHRLCLVLAVLLVLLLALPQPAQAKSGWWEWGYNSPVAGGDVWVWHDSETGEQTGDTYVLKVNDDSSRPSDLWNHTPDGYDSVDRVVDSDGSLVPRPDEEPQETAPGNESDPAGGETAPTSSTDDANGTSELTDDGAPQGQNDGLDGRRMSETDPTFELSFAFVSASVAKVLYNLVHSLCQSLMDLGRFFLSILDASTAPLFSADFEDGAFGRFYAVATSVAQRVGVPFATAFLGLSMGIAMVRASEQRRRNKAMDWGNGHLFLVLAFVVCWTLIYHAIDLVAAIYWLGTRLVALVELALSAAGIAPASASSIGDAMSQSVMGALEALTYGQSGSMWAILLVALLCTAVCAGCMLYVLTTAFLRMGEIYLRASFAPMVMAFFMGDATKQIAWGYLKRFGAVCFQAGVIVLALALSGLMFGVATEMIQPLLRGAGGLATTLAGLVPTVVCVTSITAIIRKSEAVSAGLFGLAG